MTEQQACTLCGAGGHIAAQCNWNKAEGAQGEREAFETWFLRKFYEGDRSCGLEWLSTEPCGGYRYRQAAELWEVWQARAALAQPSPVQERSTVYVEARQCDECQHGGINDSADGLAACHDCDWTGPDPAEDKCPGCQSENCMAAACPQCGARYVLVASEEIAAPVAQAGQVPEVQVCKLGTYGKAYDLPETKRAYTYAEQPDNLGASRLGSALSAAIAASAGDQIDRGLALLRELQAKGFGVFELNAAPAQGGE